LLVPVARTSRSVTHHVLRAELTRELTISDAEITHHALRAELMRSVTLATTLYVMLAMTLARCMLSQVAPLLRNGCEHADGLSRLVGL
jgi:hypothetical protein